MTATSELLVKFPPGAEALEPVKPLSVFWVMM